MKTTISVLGLGLLVALNINCQKTSGSFGPPSPGSSNGSSACKSTATLNWVAPTANTDGSALTDLAGFNAYYGISSGNYGTEVNIPNAGQTTLVIDNLTSNTYYFAMTAYNAGGQESAKTNEVSVEITNCVAASLNMQTGEKHVYNARNFQEIPFVSGVIK